MTTSMHDRPGEPAAKQPVRLLVRADDVGSSWASNIGCVKACRDGIARSVEVMMPCPWVEHAAALLQRHPEIDVGIHLTLTSEWDAMKWRPLTRAGSLVDDDGYFLPLLMPRPGDARPNLLESRWSVDDVAAELRAQIVLGLAKFPTASHVSAHMTRYLSEFHAAVGDVVSELCEEFGLRNDTQGRQVSQFQGYAKFPRDAGVRIRSFVDQLRQLEPGDHIFIDHPACDTAEMAAIGHAGYEDVREDRSSCLEVLTSEAVRHAVRDLGITLIDYRML